MNTAVFMTCPTASRPARNALELIPCVRRRYGPVALAVNVMLAAALAQPVPPTTQPATATAPAPERARRALEQIPATACPPKNPGRPLDEQPRVGQLYREARELVADEDYAGAADRLQEAMRRADGGSPELTRLLAEVLRQLGAIEPARELAQEAAALGGGSEAYGLLGLICRRQGDLDAAIGYLRQATVEPQPQPDSPHVVAAWYRLGEALTEGGYLTAAAEALDRFDAAMALVPAAVGKSEPLAAILADLPHGAIGLRLDLLRQLDRPDDAVAAAAEAVARRPKDSYVARLYAQALLSADRAEQALVFCRERLAATLTAASPDDVAATSPLVSLAVASAMASGRVDEWVGEIVGGLTDAQPLDFASAVARRLGEAGAHAAAARVWQAILMLRPGEPVAAWALATEWRAAGEIEAALDALAGFVRRYPGQAEVPFANLQGWHRATTVPDETLRVVARRAARDNPDFAESFALGAAAAAARQPDAAERFYRAALEAKPDLALADLAWGWMLLGLYRWEEAGQHAETALRQAPDLAAAHYVSGAAHAGLDENDEAERALVQATKLRPGDAGYALQLALQYRRTNNLLAAQRYFQYASSADPTLAEALENLVDTYLGGGKVEIARAQLARAEERDLPEDALRRIRTTLRYAETPFQAEHLAELTRQFDDHPDDGETGLRLAAGLFVRGRVDDAAGVIQRVASRCPDEERVLMLSARVAAQQLEHGRAAGIFEEFARRYPNRVEIQALWADSLLADFRPVEARRVLERLADSSKLAPEARLVYRRRLLAAYTAFSEFDDAVRLLDGWLTQEPEQTPWWLEKLHVLVAAGRAAEAISLAQERLRPVSEEVDRRWTELQGVAREFEQRPDDAELRERGARLQHELETHYLRLVQRRTELVQVSMEARRFQAVEELARSWLPTALEEEHRAKCTEWLVHALIEDQRPDDALAVLRDFRPGSALADIAVRGWRARAQAAAGRIDAAVEDLRSVLDERNSPLSARDRADVWQQLLEILSRAGRCDEALTCCDEWFAEMRQTDAATRVMRLALECAILQRAGRTEDYIKAAEQWLALDPDNAGLNNDLGYTWVEAGRNLARATQMIRKAVADQPLNAAYLDSLGWAFYQAGDFDGAREYLHRGARLREGQDGVIFEHLGDAEYRLGNSAAAGRAWQKAIELLEAQPPGRARPDHVQVLARVRSKLAALARSGAVDVAPTAAELTRPGQ